MVDQKQMNSRIDWAMSHGLDFKVEYKIRHLDSRSLYGGHTVITMSEKLNIWWRIILSLCMGSDKARGIHNFRRTQKSDHNVSLLIHPQTAQYLGKPVEFRPANFICQCEYDRKICDHHESIQPDNWR